MLRSMTPEQARAQVERICAERGITKDKLNQTIAEARQIAQVLGIR